MAEARSGICAQYSEILEDLRSFSKELREEREASREEDEKRKESFKWIRDWNKREEMKKEIGNSAKKAANMETKTKQIEERLEADRRNVKKEEVERRCFDVEGIKKRVDSIEEKRTGKIDAYLSPRIEKRKMEESPEVKEKKERKRKCSKEMDESGLETKEMLTQVLNELRELRGEVKECKEELREVRRTTKDFASKLDNIEIKTKQIEERVEADERNVKKIKEEEKRNKLNLEKTKKRVDGIEEEIKKLAKKNKDFERKEERIDSQLEKIIKGKIGNVEDFNQMVKRSTEEIIGKQRQKKEENFISIRRGERKWEDWERERRKNNVIIKGLETNERMDKKKVEDWVEEKLGIRVNLNKIWIIKRLALVGAECRDKEEKEKIMANKKKLRGTKFYVDNDLTYKERRNKEELWKTAKKHREQGKTVKIGYNKLTIDEEVYKWDEWKGELFRKSFKVTVSK